MDKAPESVILSLERSRGGKVWESSRTNSLVGVYEVSGVHCGGI